MKNIVNKAFTLAEIMIVLTVIGIMAAILVPTAFRSTPDENVLKFKKANNMLFQVIKNLANNSENYLQGDFGKKSDGTDVTDTTYFCKTIAELLSTKTVDCETAYGDEKSHIDITVEDDEGKVTSSLSQIKTAEDINADARCLAAQANTIKADKQIVTSDGIVWFEESSNTPFGALDDNSKRLFGNTTDHSDPTGFDAIYKIYCLDVDGYDSENTENEPPFGYAIRADGKIITGARADEWLEKSAQEKK